MQALALHAWSAGLARRPFLFTALTVGVCAVFAARAAGSLIDARLDAAGPAASRGRSPPPRAPAGRARPDGSQLVARNMFCSSCAAGAAAADAPGVAVLPASLIAINRAREPWATLIVTSTAVQGAWATGDAIPGLGRLDRIGATWVEIVDGEGRRGRLSLRPRTADTAPSADVTDRVPPSAAGPWSQRVQPIDDQTYEVDRSLVRELVTGTTRAGSARIFPVTSSDGGSALRLSGVTPASIPAALGLRNGDTLSAINGAPIRGLQQLLDLYAGLDQLTSVEISGARAGVPLVRTLRLR
jgi:hypothetical protein